MSHARTPLVRLGAIALASGAALGAVAGTAGAATPGSSGNSDANAVPASLAGIKAKAATDITERVTSLNAAIGKVDAAKGLGASQATLVSYLGTDSAPLQQLNQTIQGQHGAAGVPRLRDDLQRLPRVQARAARRLDRRRRRPRYHDRHPEPHGGRRQGAGSGDAGQPGHRAAAHQRPQRPDQHCDQLTNGLAATVLAFTPAQWDADHALLNASKSSDQAATGALQKGRADVKQIVQDLKSAHMAAATTTTTTG